MNQMLKVMAFEWANNGICVNAVCAGYSETLPTKIFQASPVKKELSLKISLGRLTTPEEIVASVRILSSTKCDYVPGHVLFVH